MFEDRIEIKNPGGIYGRIRVDQLGKLQPDTRNPVIASALEVLKITENRYSGIPTIRRTMNEYNLPQPKFADERGNFVVTLYKHQQNENVPSAESEKINAILQFCQIPRTRKEICEYLGISSVTYAIQTHIMPLVESGLLQQTIQEKPSSSKQKYYSKGENC